MVIVDKAQCTGCGSCISVCPQKAITLNDNTAMINEDLCRQCGNCACICPAGAIIELAPASLELTRVGEKMQYGYGRGFGFRGASPPWPYIGHVRGGLPRCWHLGLWGAAFYAPPVPYPPMPTRQEELGFLKNQAEAIKSQLEDIECRIQKIEKKD